MVLRGLHPSFKPRAPISQLEDVLPPNISALPLIVGILTLSPCDSIRGVSGLQNESTGEGCDHAQ